jgi:hypothetical protein
VIVVSKVDWTMYPSIGGGRRVMLPAGEAMLIPDAEIEADPQMRQEIGSCVSTASLRSSRASAPRKP